MKRLLLLGGIGEALALARRLGPAHLYSLAGLGKVPGDLACRVRVGGYGGAEGLAAFIDEQGFDLLVDATHPYAARISRNAVRAARLAGVPCWALRRPGWQAGPGDDWREVADWRELIAALAPFRRPLFTSAANRWSISARSRRTSTGPCAACKASRLRRAPR